MPLIIPPPGARAAKEMKMEVREEPPPTLSSQAPVIMTSLLQDVLGIMNNIMAQQGSVDLEDSLLKSMTELVVIMQEEVEALVEMADIVEEFTEAVEEELREEGIGDWVRELGLDDFIPGGDGNLGNKEAVMQEGLGVRRVGREPEKENNKSFHEREDSGVGVDDDEESGIEPLSPMRFAVPKPQPIIPQPPPTPRYLEDYTGPPIMTGARIVIPKRIEALPPKKEKRIFASTKPTRMKKKKVKAPPAFRDSGLDLLSPNISPSPTLRSPGRPPGRPPRWI